MAEEFLEQRLIGLVEDVREDVQPSAVRHPDHDRSRAGVCAALDGFEVGLDELEFQGGAAAVEHQHVHGRPSYSARGRIPRNKAETACVCYSVIVNYNTGMRDHEWNDDQPIYRQLRDRVVAMILDGVLKEGDPLPSVRNVAAEYRVNPLTVLKGYQQLVDEQLVESRRGRGMYVNAGARDLLLQGERQRFLAEEWPRVHATIRRLGLTAKELMEDGARRRAKPVGAGKER